MSRGPEGNGAGRHRDIEGAEFEESEESGGNTRRRGGNGFNVVRTVAGITAGVFGLTIAGHEIGRHSGKNEERPATSRDEGETDDRREPASTTEASSTSSGEGNQSETRESATNCFDLNVQFSGVHAPAEGNTLHLEYYVMSTGSQPLPERACRTIEGLSDIPGEPNTEGRLSSLVARDLDTFLTREGVIPSSANMRVLREERVLLTEQQYGQNRAVHIAEDTDVAQNQFLVAMLVERNAQGAIVRNSLPKVVPYNREEPPTFARFGVVGESVWEYPGQRSPRLSQESGEGLLGE